MKEEETARLMRMWEPENALFDEGFALVAGVDEAGRGPLAGDVFAAAVILPKGYLPEGLNDSKKISEKKRERLYDEIIANAEAWGIGRATPEEIDTVNILNATFLAMQRAVEALAITPHMALVDGNRAPGLSVPCRTLVKGDSLSVSIAAASILAKVSRDRYIVELDKAYPAYGFAAHKGYGTKAHMEALKAYGPCPIHRKTFLKNLGDLPCGN